MSAQQQAKQLFEYISHVLAIDLPVTRDVSGYRAELWWQKDLVPCSQCVVREFDAASSENDQGGEDPLTQPEPWLSAHIRTGWRVRRDHHKPDRFAPRRCLPGAGRFWR